MADAQNEILKTDRMISTHRSLLASVQEKENSKPLLKKRAAKRSSSKRVRAGGSGLFVLKPKSAGRIGRTISANKPL